MPGAKSEQTDVPTVTRVDIVRGLVEVGLVPGDCVLVHASLSSFGRVEGGPDAVIDAVLEVIGPAGTAVFPTFTGDAVIEAILNESGSKETAIFPKWTGTPVGDLSKPALECIFTGAIPKAARQRSDFVKSSHPLYSICAKGPLAAEIAASADRYIFPAREKKFVHLIGEKGGKSLLLGTGHLANSAVHLVAEFGGLEYKMQDRAYWSVTVKEFLQMPRKKQAEMLIPHMGMNLPYGLKKCHDRIEASLRKAGVIRFGKIGNAEVRLMKIADFVRVGLEAVRRNPWLLMDKVPKT